jgi:hypothetical protein
VASAVRSSASLSPSPLPSLSRSRAMTSPGTRSSPGCGWARNDEEPRVLSPQHTRAWKSEHVEARPQNGESVPEHMSLTGPILDHEHGNTTRRSGGARSPSEH